MTVKAIAAQTPVEALREMSRFVFQQEVVCNICLRLIFNHNEEKHQIIAVFTIPSITKWARMTVLVNKTLWTPELGEKQLEQEVFFFKRPAETSLPNQEVIQLGTLISFENLPSPNCFTPRVSSDSLFRRSNVLKLMEKILRKEHIAFLADFVVTYLQKKRKAEWL